LSWSMPVNWANAIALKSGGRDVGKYSATPRYWIRGNSICV